MKLTRLLWLPLAVWGSTCGCDPGATSPRTEAAEAESCGLGRVICGGDCVTLGEDPNHCGDCAGQCEQEELCDLGSCQPAAEGCTGSLVACERGCRDLEGNSEHCGRCNNACPAEASCRGGSCECLDGRALCRSACVDLETDEANCGACGDPCPAGQYCNEGRCECPADQELCGRTCVDTSADRDHCGRCDEACREDEACSSGQCACPPVQSECSGACVDLLQDAHHCGECDQTCSEEEVCWGGECACPEEREVCGERCVDLLSDSQNCGQCGARCELGDGCQGGECIVAALGADGCQGLAEGLVIDQIAAYQTVKTEVAREGALRLERSVELVSGKQTLVRLFVRLGPDWERRELSARLHLQSPPPGLSGGLGGSTVETVADGGTTLELSGPISTLYSAAKIRPVDASEEADRSSAFEFTVPGESVTPGTRFAAELVECNAALPGAREASAENDPVGAEVLTAERDAGIVEAFPPGPRFPVLGGAPLGAIDTGPLRLHLIPMGAGDFVADTSAETLALMERALIATYPVASVRITVGEPLELTDPYDWGQTLLEARTRRERDRPDPATYYYGMVRPSRDFADFCQGACTVGVGFRPDKPVEEQGARVAVGLAFGDVSSTFIMLHELGHNLGRDHSPCVFEGGEIGAVDPNYPYEGGGTGVFGYSSVTDRLVPPNEFTDLMGYCSNQWLSDYTYSGLLSTVVGIRAQRDTLEFRASDRGHFRVLLWDADRGARWGSTPANEIRAPLGHPEEATVLDALANPMGTTTVYRSAMPDLGYSFDVPQPETGWIAIRVAGAEAILF